MEEELDGKDGWARTWIRAYIRQNVRAVAARVGSATLVARVCPVATKYDKRARVELNSQCRDRKACPLR